MTRTAISPRLAMRIFPNMGGAGEYPRRSGPPLGVLEAAGRAREAALELAEPGVVVGSPGVGPGPIEIESLAPVPDLGAQFVQGGLPQRRSRRRRAARSSASRSARSLSARRWAASFFLATSSHRAANDASAERWPGPTCFIGPSVMDMTSLRSDMKATGNAGAETLGRGATTGV